MAIMVEVGGGGRTVPFTIRHTRIRRPFAERAVPIIPEERVYTVGGEEQIRPAVGVQIGGQTAIAAHG